MAKKQKAKSVSYREKMKQKVAKSKTSTGRKRAAKKAARKR